MGTYWDDFIKKYKNSLYLKCLSDILESFWYFCKGDTKKSDEIMSLRYKGDNP